MGLPADVRALLAAHGVVSRRRLLAMGCPSATIDWWLERGLLTAHARGHYTEPAIVPDGRGRLVIALDRSGEGARVGGAWACGLWQLEGFDLSGRGHVLVGPHRRVRGADFTVVRSPVPPVDQAVVSGLPTVTATRGLIGAAPTHPAKVVRVAYDHARREGLTSFAELSERAVDLGRVYGAPEMRWLLATGDFRFESEGERALNRLWLPADPIPEPQVWVAYRSRWYRLDFAFLDARLCLEYDGRAYHTAEADRLRDYERDLALAELNIQTLRVSARMLRTPARTRRQVLAVRQDRLALGLPPIVPCPPPDWPR